MKYVLSSILLLALSAVKAATESSLRFVWKLNAEGSLSPAWLSEENRDVYSEQWDSTSTLTPSGYRQEFLLGVHDRSKYRELLNTKYTSEEVYVRAYNSNSTLMSVNAYLQGLYPNNGPNLYPNQRVSAMPPVRTNSFGEFNRDTFGAQALPRNVQVVPVTTFDLEDRQYVFLDFNECGKIHSRIKSNSKSDKVKTWLKNFKELYGSRLLKILQISDDDAFTDYKYVSLLLSTFLRDYREGKVLKKFNDAGINLQTFNQTATEFEALHMYDVTNGYFYEEPYLANLTMSGFADELHMWLENRVTRDLAGDHQYQRYEAPKMVVFSVHAHTLGSVVTYLGRNKGVNPVHLHPASSLAFELRMVSEVSNSTNSTVAVEYTEANFVVDVVVDGLVLKTISYLEFQDMLENTWTLEKSLDSCSLDKIWRYGFKNATITLAVLLGVCFILLIVFIILCCVARSKVAHDDDHEHSRVENTEKKEFNNNDQNQEQRQDGEVQQE